MKDDVGNSVEVKIVAFFIHYEVPVANGPRTVYQGTGKKLSGITGRVLGTILKKLSRPHFKRW